MKFTSEQLAKAKEAKSAEELLAIAKESGIEMTAEEAAKYYAEFHKEGELAEDELANVSGGGCGGEDESKTHEAHLSFQGANAEEDNCYCPVCGAYMTFIEATTSKSGLGAYYKYYCPTGDAYFRKEIITYGVSWHLW